MADPRKITFYPWSIWLGLFVLAVSLLVFVNYFFNSRKAENSSEYLSKNTSIQKNSKLKVLNQDSSNTKQDVGRQGNIAPVETKKELVSDSEKTIASTHKNPFGKKGTIISSHKSLPDSNGHVEEVKIVKTDFKYPYLRVVETFLKDPVSGVEKVLKQEAMVADHLIVKLAAGVGEPSLETLNQKYGAKILKKMLAPGTYIVELSEHDVDSLTKAMDAYRQETSVVSYAEPDYVAQMDTATNMPNDNSFSQLWGLNNTGQTIGGAIGTSDADIDAPEAWSIATGSKSVLVGVLDSGVDYNHPDLSPNIWTNPGEIQGNGIDDDGNGFIDDVHGWDFANNDSDPIDDNCHGTHVAGIIGATGNNNIGVVGVCWNISIVSIKIADADGVWVATDAINAVYYATKVGVHLTSNSWGGSGFSQTLKDAITDADNHGILFITSAGNDGVDTDVSPHYPSAYDNPNIIAVAATDQNDALAQFTPPKSSNYGATTVDLAAPGKNIFSTFPTFVTSYMSSKGFSTNYQSISGTSTAAPYVAGVCALLKSVVPSITHTQTKTFVMSSVDPIPSLSGKCVTGGRLNVLRALQSATGGPSLPTAPSNLVTVVISANQINLTWNDQSNDETDFKIERSMSLTGPYAQITTVSANTVAYSDTSLITDTTYWYRIRSTNSAGDSAYTSPASAATLPLAPIAPTSLAATAVSNSQINLTWVDNSNNEADFKIERSSGGSAFVQIATVSTNTVAYSDSGLSPDTQYTYRIRSTNLGGDSNYSNLANATTWPLPPSIPSNLVATAISTIQINLSWIDGSVNETGFEIEHSLSVGGPYSLLATVGINGIAYNDIGLNTGTTYFYRVRAINSGGNSGYSNIGSATTLSPPPSLPAIPGNLVATATSSSQTSLSWIDQSNNESGFKIERSMGGSNYVQIAVVGANILTYGDVGLTESTLYSYRIRSTNSAGDSSYSNIASATTLVTVPSPPSKLAATAVSSSQINLSWVDQSNNESGFKVERSINSGAYLQIATVAANITTYNDTGLTADTIYAYRVRSTNSAGDSVYSNVTNTKTNPSFPLPMAPLNLYVVAFSSNQATLMWTDHSSNETNFKVYRKEGSGSFTLKATLGANVTSYIDNALANNATYSYKVVAVNGAGNSPDSNISTVTSLGKPINPVATAVSSSQINVSWTDASTTETNFQVYRSTIVSGSTNDVPYSIVGTTGAGTGSTVSYSDSTGLSANTTYYYTVQAVNPVGHSYSSYSTIVNASITTIGFQAPSDLVASVISETQVNLSWIDNSSIEVGFVIERRAGRNDVYTQIATVSANITTYDDKELMPHTSYFYRVRAISSSGSSNPLIGHSAYSNEASATTKHLVVVAALDGGAFHSVGLRNDGTVWTWGDNKFSQLGNGVSGGQALVPTQVNGLSGITDVSAGAFHTVALKSDCTVWTWGYNVFGQLGDGTTIQRNFPVQVKGLSDIIAIAAGGYHTVALRADGTVWAWGDNSQGELGDKTTTQRLTPVQVSGLTGVTALSGGPWRTFALKSDGTVWAWGYNYGGYNFGCLGDGTMIRRTSPVQVVGLSNVVAISTDAGMAVHTVALKSDGTVWAWGGNSWYNQLGDGTSLNSSVPVQVKGLSGIINVTAGSFHSIASKSDGTLWVWGATELLGLDSTLFFQNLEPVQLGGLSGVVGLAGGVWHTLVLKSDGTVWAWGDNNYGQLGTGTTTPMEYPAVKVPVQVKGLDLILDH